MPDWRVLTDLMVSRAESLVQGRTNVQQLKAFPPVNWGVGP